MLVCICPLPLRYTRVAEILRAGIRISGSKLSNRHVWSGGEEVGDDARKSAGVVGSIKMYDVFEVLLTLATEKSVLFTFLPGKEGEYGRKGLRRLIATGPRGGDGCVYGGVASREDSVDELESSGLCAL